MTFAPKLTLNLRALLILILIASNLLIMWLSVDSLRKSRALYLSNAEALTQNVASGVAQNLTATVDKIDLALEAIVDELEAQLARGPIQVTAANVFMAKMEKRLPEVDGFRASDEQGLVFVGNGLTPGSLARNDDRDYFLHHKATRHSGLFVAKPVWGRIALQHIMIFARRYNRPSGEFAGVVHATVSLDQISGLLSGYDLGTHGAVVVRDSDLGLIARYPPVPDQPSGQVGNPAVSVELRRLYDSGVKSATYQTVSGADGYSRLVTFQTIGRAPMVVNAGMWTREVLASWEASAYRVGALCAAFLLMSSILGVMLLRLLRQTMDDLAERKAAGAIIEQLAFFDPLTALPNRRRVLDQLEQAAKASALTGRFGALMLLDMDNFKALNDKHGHDVGDQFLVEVARRITACLRTRDMAGRLGGDEFVVILDNLPDVTSATDAALAVAEKVLKSLRQPYALKLFDPQQLVVQREHHCTCSIGITVFQGGDALPDELMRRADTAMYQAKGKGRNTFQLFSSAMQAGVTARADLEADLREATQTQQFELHYQPQMSASGQCAGLEALLRWTHPTRGPVAPKDFIPVAEDTGLILPIGQWVLNQACQQLARWGSQAAFAQLVLSVNVSARQFNQPDFAAQVLDALRASEANPRRLKLELTESLLIQNIDDVIEKMQALQVHGVSFALDDFGTGYSSLAYLKRMPLDQLKIDQSFVRDIMIDANDAAISKTIVSLADNLGLQVVAEGVETQAQRDLLAQQGCYHYQGYLFSDAVTPEALEVYLTTLNNVSHPGGLETTAPS